MKAIARALVVILVALIAVPALAVSVTLTTAVQLLAATAFIMGGTGHSLGPDDDPSYVSNYMQTMTTQYIVPGNGVTPDSTVAVIYPAQFSPFSGTTTFEDTVTAVSNNHVGCLRGTSCNGGSAPARDSDDTFIVLGFSASAVVASLVKGDLITNPGNAPADTEFDLIANPTRPNGGILGRGFQGFTIPIFDIPFYGPTPNSCPSADPCTADEVGHPVYKTVDVVQQYDLLGGDAPARLDPLAFANSLAAYALLHGDMQNRSLDEADPPVIYQGVYGDTTYYMVTAPRLPLLMLLEQAGVPGAALALPDAVLRVMLEDKYRRDLSPGEHVQFQLSPTGNPVALVGNMLGAIPVGIDDTVQQATGTDQRPFGTADVYRPFGVGGPVYDKEDGSLAEDNIGIPTGAGDYPAGPLQTLAAPEAGDAKLAKGSDPAELQNDETEQDETEQTETTPEVTKPRPLQVIRESLNFDPTKRPAATRPGGDGPLKRIVNALTGQRPKPAAETGAGDEPKQENADAPAA